MPHRVRSPDDPTARLRLAARTGKLSALQKLLGREPPWRINEAREEDGWTALHLACFWGHSDCARALIRGGAAVDVQDIGCDFYAITGHKLYGPSASGAIYIRSERLAEMRPFMGGGDMIKEVSKDNVTYADPPMKFEAGTPGIVQTIGFGAALEYMMGLGMQDIAAHENRLRDYAVTKLSGLNWLQLQGTTPDKGAIFSFTLEGAAHAHDISTILDKKGVAVRAGQHCTGPLMQHLELNATCRASFAMYNTRDEVDVLIEALELAHDLFA